MSTYDFDVFLSHNSRDKGDVEKLKGLLVKRGIRCWLDKDELPPGREWLPLLRKGLENCLSIAVCYGRAGIGPWQDNEIKMALRIAVEDGRAVVPVLLPDAGAEPELPAFFRERTWVDCRGGFHDDKLRLLEWGVKGKKPEQSAESASADGTVPLLSEEQKERLLRVFGPQFSAMREILCDNEPLRLLLFERFGVTTPDLHSALLETFYRFHVQFLESVGAFGRLHQTTSHKKELAELVASVMFLGMSPELALDVRARAPHLSAATIAIHPDAREGISQLLISWAQGDPKLPPQAMSPEKSMGFFESTPQMSASEVRLSLMDRVGIRPGDPDADQQLESLIKVRNHFGQPLHLTIAESSLLEEIRRPGSPLRELLVFVKSRAASIDPRRGARYDADFEIHFAELKKVFGAR